MAEVHVGGAPNIHVAPRDAWLVAATVLVDAAQHTRLADVFARGVAECRSELAREQTLQGLRDAAAKLPAGRIGILPMSDSGNPVINLLQRSRLVKKCRQLSPDELLNPQTFNAKNLPVVLYLGGEEYAGSIHKPGDGAEAVLDYLRAGGMLAILASQPLPFFYDGPSHPHRVRSLTPQMGMPIGMGFEHPPEGVSLWMLANPAQSWIRGLPAEMPFFRDGDLRLRAVQPSDVSRDARYTPIVSIRSGDGHEFGDAAAMAEFTRGPFKGARVLYVWSRLTADAQLGPGIVEQVLRRVISAAEQ